MTECSNVWTFGVVFSAVRNAGSAVGEAKGSGPIEVLGFGPGRTLGRLPARDRAEWARISAQRGGAYIQPVNPG